METDLQNTMDIPMTDAPSLPASDARLLRHALVLGLITIAYNLAEGAVSVAFGMSEETLALFGFGVDSFVEVISGVGIVHMVLRMRRSPVHDRDAFERRALRITGTAFYLLCCGLLVGAVYNIATGAVPESTLPGIVISVLSILTMYFLLRAKLRTGRALRSDAIVADAQCTRTCLYLSVVLLLSSGLYALVALPWIDGIGSLAIAVFAFREGREAFEKARSGALACSCH